MMDLMPSDALTALYTQLKGFERYAKQYYLSKGKDEDEPEPEPQPDPDVTPVKPNKPMASINSNPSKQCHIVCSDLRFVG